MAMLGWIILAAAMAVWACGVLGWFDELAEILRGKRP